MSALVAGKGGPLKDWPQVTDEAGELVARLYGPGAEDRAHLFAAAPDLLEALRECFTGLIRLRDRGVIGDAPYIRQAGAAIARAEGRAP